MNIRAIAMLCLAALLGAVAVFLARDWIESQVPSQVVITKDRVPLTKIVVARRDLFLGDQLKSGTLEEREWPTHAVPAGSFKSLEKLIEEDRVVLRSILANEPVLANKITGKGERTTLSPVISKNMLGNCYGRGLIPAVWRSLSWRCTREDPWFALRQRHQRQMGRLRDGRQGR